MVLETHRRRRPRGPIRGTTIVSSPIILGAVWPSLFHYFSYVRTNQNRRHRNGHRFRPKQNRRCRNGHRSRGWLGKADQNKRRSNRRRSWSSQNWRRSNGHAYQGHTGQSKSTPYERPSWVGGKRGGDAKHFAVSTTKRTFGQAKRACRGGVLMSSCMPVVLVRP